MKVTKVTVTKSVGPVVHKSRGTQVKINLLANSSQTLSTEIWKMIVFVNTHTHSSCCSSKTVTVERFVIALHISLVPYQNVRSHDFSKLLSVTFL